MKKHKHKYIKLKVKFRFDLIMKPIIGTKPNSTLQITYCKKCKIMKKMTLTKFLNNMEKRLLKKY